MALQHPVRGLAAIELVRAILGRLRRATPLLAVVGAVAVGGACGQGSGAATGRSTGRVTSPAKSVDVAARRWLAGERANAQFALAVHGAGGMSVDLLEGIAAINPRGGRYLLESKTSGGTRTCFSDGGWQSVARIAGGGSRSVKVYSKPVLPSIASLFEQNPLLAVAATEGHGRVSVGRHAKVDGSRVTEYRYRLRPRMVARLAGSLASRTDSTPVADAVASEFTPTSARLLTVTEWIASPSGTLRRAQYAYGPVRKATGLESEIVTWDFNPTSMRSARLACSRG